MYRIICIGAAFFLITAGVAWAELTAVIRGAVIRGAVIAPVVADPCTGTSSLPADIGVQCVRGPVAGGDVTKKALYAGTYNTHSYMTTPSGCGSAIPSTDTCEGGDDVAGGTDLQWASGSPADGNQIIASPSEVDGKIQSATIGAYPTALAASFCENMVFGGYDDWYLPANGTTNTGLGELQNVLYNNRVKLAVGGGAFSENHRYWSSTEMNAWRAWYQNFYDGVQDSLNKTSLGGGHVRCVRRY